MLLDAFVGHQAVPLWVTLLGFAAPLIALAGSAVGYVVKLYQGAAARKRDQFFELMAFIDSHDRPIATKVAAVYRLRDFPKDRNFIVRFCRTQRENIQGSAAQSLREEMDATALFFQNNSDPI
ncbi:hypothetical protein C6558_29310 [Ensifer sp. NM-2]|nr:hypothetical protein ASD03_14560 [Ensifer sp. Root127]PSS61201.1 hypothetical protein C6558_29310 [Ensifer sp. NM-2]